MRMDMSGSIAWARYRICASSLSLSGVARNSTRTRVARRNRSMLSCASRLRAHGSRDGRVSDLPRQQDRQSGLEAEVTRPWKPSGRLHSGLASRKLPKACRSQWQDQRCGEPLNKAKLRRQLVQLPKRTRRHCAVGGQGVGWFRVAIGPAIHYAYSGRRTARNREQFCRSGYRLRACRRPVVIKFETFRYAQYGMAEGTGRTVNLNSFTRPGRGRLPTGALPATASEVLLSYLDYHRPGRAARCSRVPVFPSDFT